MPKKNKLYRKPLSRKDALQKASTAFLLVFEGTETERSYFKFIKNEYSLQNVDFGKKKKSKSNPLSIVERAKEISDQKDIIGKVSDGGNDDYYDYIYCIFDRNGHTDFNPALDKIKQIQREFKNENKKTKIEAIVSYPCFELWLLYHFVYTDKKQGKCQSVRKILKKQNKFLKFNKTLNDGQLNLLYQNINVAIKNGKQSIKRAKTTGQENPSTNVHLIMEEFIDEYNKW